MIIDYQVGFFLTPQGCHKGELCHPFGIWVRDLFNLESFHPFGIDYVILRKRSLRPKNLFWRGRDPSLSLRVTWLGYILKTPKLFSSTGEFNTTDNANPKT